MGNCYGSKYKFEKYIIIDKKNNLIVGIWLNPKTKLLQQGIKIGSSSISVLKYSIKIADESVIYNFDNNIRLTLKKKNGVVDYELITSKKIIFDNVDTNRLKKYNKIDENSNDIDYILSFINKSII